MRADVHEHISVRRTDFGLALTRRRRGHVRGSRHVVRGHAWTRRATPHAARAARRGATRPTAEARSVLKKAKIPRDACDTQTCLQLCTAMRRAINAPQALAHSLCCPRQRRSLERARQTAHAHARSSHKGRATHTRSARSTQLHTHSRTESYPLPGSSSLSIPHATCALSPAARGPRDGRRRCLRATARPLAWTLPHTAAAALLYSSSSMALFLKRYSAR